MVFLRRNADNIQKTDSLEGIFPDWKDEERWLFIGPHDDDIVLGSGITIQAAIEAGVDVFALIVTDGTMGYCTVEQKDEIGRLRRGETLASCKILGIREDNIFFAGMPDGNTASYRGRRKAGPGDPAIEGYTGLQNLFTYYLRLLRPTRIFLPTGEDLHPDHKVVSEEVLISIFHAAGSIWPELGKSIATPLIYEFAVYCDFRDPPNLKLEADERSFQRKLEGILAFSSQEQILSLIKNIEDGGPFEYIREVIFKLYSADNYRDLF